MQHQRMGDFSYYGDDGHDRPKLWPPWALRPLLEAAIPPTRVKQKGIPVSVQSALFDYDRMELQLPDHLISRLTDTHTPAHDPRYSTQARKILVRTKWKDLATGSLPPGLDELRPTRTTPSLRSKRTRDDSEPIPYSANPAFVYPTGLQLTERDKDPPTKKLRAVAVDDEEDEHVYDGFKYGWLGVRNDGENLLHIAELDGDGAPTRTGKSEVRHPDETTPTVRWRKGVLGPAEFTYPHPHRWTLKYSTNTVPIPKMNTKILTEIIATKEDGDAPPNAQAKWEAAVGDSSVPWHHVWQKVCHPLLTRLDIKNMMTVLHRRIWHPEAAVCPNCDLGEDRLSHLIQCPYTIAVFAKLFPDDTFNISFLVLGLRQGKIPLRGLEAMLHTLAWKYVYASLISGRLHGTPPSRERALARNVVRHAQRRLRAGAAKLKIYDLQRQARGEPTDPNLHDKYNAKITPAKYSKKLKIILPKYLTALLREE